MKTILGFLLPLIFLFQVSLLNASGIKVEIEKLSSHPETFHPANGLKIPHEVTAIVEVSSKFPFLLKGTLQSHLTYFSPKGETIALLRENTPVVTIHPGCNFPLFKKLTHFFHKGHADKSRRLWDHYSRSSKGKKEKVILVQFEWDGKSLQNQPLYSGKYSYRLSTTFLRNSDSQSGSFKIVGEDEKPVLRLADTNPDNGDTLTSLSFPFNGRFNQDLKKVTITAEGKNVSVKIDGKLFHSQLNFKTPGTKKVHLKAEGEQGSRFEKELSFILKSEPAPRVVSTNPAEGSVVSQTSFTLSGVLDRAASTVRFKSSGRSFSASVKGKTFSGSLSLSDGNGAKTVEIIAVGNHGAESAHTLHLTLKEKARPPSLSLNSPKNNQQVLSSLVTFSGNVDQKDCTLTITGGKKTVQIKLKSTSFNQVVELKNNGKNLITVKVTNSANLSDTTTLTLYLKVPPKPPVFSQITPKSGFQTFNPEVTIQGEVDSDCLKVTFQIGKTITHATLKGRTFEGKIRLPSQGAHTIELLALARNSLVGRTKVTYHLLPKPKPPVLSNLSPDNGSFHKTRNIILSGKVTPKESSVRLQADGKWRTLRVDNGEFRERVNFSSDGTKKLILEASHGALKTAKNLSLVIDTVKPTITIQSPKEGEFFNTAAVPFKALLVESFPNTSTLENNGRSIPFQITGQNVTAQIPLQKGRNQIKFSHTDKAGNYADKRVEIHHTPITLELTSFSDHPDPITPDESHNKISHLLTFYKVEGFSPPFKKLTINGQANYKNQAGKTVRTVNGTFPVHFIPWNCSRNDFHHSTRAFHGNDSDLEERLWSLFRSHSRPIKTWYGVGLFKFDGKDSKGKLLPTGLYNYTVNGSLVSGNQTLTQHPPANGNLTIKRVDAHPPKISSLKPANGSYANKSKIKLTGQVDQNNVSVWAVIDGNRLNASVTGKNFTLTIPLNHEGPNPLTLFAENQAGKKSSLLLTYHRDTVDPVVTVQTPVDEETYHDLTLPFSGSFTEAHTQQISLLLNGKNWPFHQSGNNLSASLKLLPERENHLSLTVTDKAGNKGVKTLSFHHSKKFGLEIVKFDDQPDPFTPNGDDQNDFSKLFVVFKAENLLPFHWAHKNLKIEATATYKNSAGQIVRALTQELPLFRIPWGCSLSDFKKWTHHIHKGHENHFKHLWAHFLKHRFKLNDRYVFAMFIWDGATTQNQPAPAGIYNYTLTGTLKKHNQVLATAEPKTGTVTLTRGAQTPPVVSAINPPTGTYLKTKTLNLTGSVDQDGVLVTVSLNNQNHPATMNGRNFSITLTLNEGANTLSLKAVNPAGLETTLSLNYPVDTLAPQLAIQSPPNGLFTNQSSVNFSGSFTETNPKTIQLLLNNTPVNFTQTGNQITANLTLAPNQSNSLIFQITDLAGNLTTLTRSLTHDSIAPALNITSPIDGNWVKQAAILLTGSVSEPNQPSVTLNFNGQNTPLPLTNNSFNKSLVLLNQGSTLLTVTATDAAGNQTVKTVTVKLDSILPALSIQQPLDGSTVSTNPIPFSASFTETNPSLIELKLNGNTVPHTQNGTQVTASLNLTENTANTILFSITDLAGNKTDKTIQVIHEKGEAPVLTLTAPQNQSFSNQQNTTLSGSASDPNAVVTLTLNGQPQTLTLVNGAFSLTVPLTEGANTLQVTAVNNFGTTTESRTVTRDTLLPVVTISQPAQGFLTAQSSLSFSGNFTELNPQTIQLLLNRTPVPHTQNGTQISANVTLALNQSNTLTLKVTDQAGNTAETAITGTHDSIAPAITLSQPTENQWTNSQNFTFQGTLNDPTAQLNVTTNGQNQAIPLNGNQFNISLPVTSEGANSYSFQAQDPAGNSSTLIRNLNRDTQNPAVTISAPQNGLLTNALTVNFQGQFTEPNPGQITLTLNGTPVTFTQTGTTLTAPLTLTPNTLNTLTLQVTDLAGNTALNTVTLTHDSIAPLVSISTPQGGSFTNLSLLTLFGTVNDTTAILTLEVNGVSSPLPLNGNNFSQNIPAPTDGVYTLKVIAKDLAGNQSEVTVGVTRDTIDPEIQITNPQEGFITSQLEIPFSGSINETNPESVSLSLNGNQVNLTASGNFYIANLFLTADLENTLNFSATDKAGNQKSLLRKITQVSSVPQITFFYPSNNSWQATATLNIRGNVSDPQASLNILFDSQKISLPNENGEFYFSTLLPHDGDFQFLVTAENIAGVTATESLLVHLDRLFPQVSISSPTLDLRTNQTFLNISADFTEANVQEISLTYGGIPVSYTLLSGKVVAQVNLAANTTKDLIFTVKDLAGNTATSKRTIIQDSSPPILTINSPLENQWFKTNFVFVQGSLNEDGGVEISYKGNSYFPPVSNRSFSLGIPTTLEGLQVITVTGIDLAGNRSAKTINFQVDTLSPVIQVTTPNHNSVVNETEITYQAIINELNLGSVTLKINNQAIGFTLNNNQVTATLILTNEGEHTVSLLVFDQAGNQTESIIKVIKDSLPPQISVTSPANNPSFTNQLQVIISGSLSEAPTQFTLNGNPVAFNSQTLEFSLNVDLLEGPNSFLLEAMDSAGNSSLANILLNLDTVNPELAVQIPSEGSVIITPQFPIKVVFSDNYSGMDTSTLSGKLDGVPFTFTNLTDDFADTLFTTQLSQGIHEILVSVKDNAGNVQTVLSTFTLDLSPPQLTLNPVFSPTTQLAQTISGQVEGGSKVDLLFFSNAQGGPAIIQEGNPLADWNFFQPALSLGTNTFRVNAFDFGGNKTSLFSSIFFAPEDSEFASQALNFTEGFNLLTLEVEDLAGNITIATYTILADFTPPTLVLSNPQEGQTVILASSTLIAEVSDALSGVDPESVQLEIDGTDYSYLVELNGSALQVSMENLLPEGSHHLVLEIADKAGNKTTLTRNFVSDFIAPKFLFYSFFPTSPTNFPTLSIIGAVDDGSSTLTINQQSVTLIPPFFGSVYNFSFNLNLTEGVNLIEAVLLDPAGNKIVKTETLILDTAAPVGEFLTPTQGEIFSSPSLWVTLTATDTTLPLKVTVNEQPAEPNNGQYLSHLFLSPGANTIFVKLEDGAGNQTLLQRDVFLLATDTPLINFSSPQANSIESPYPLISFTVFTETNPLATDSLTVVLDDTDLSSKFSSNQATFTFDFSEEPPLKNGSHTLFVSIRDIAGNLGFASLTFGTNNSDSPPKFFINGVVLDAETEQPIENVHFTLRDSGETNNSDNLGNYNLGSLVSGLQVIEVDGTHLSPNGNSNFRYPKVHVGLEFQNDLLASLTFPIYLTRVDKSGEILVTPEMVDQEGKLLSDLTVTSANEGNFYLKILSGTKITFPDGANSGKAISLTPIPFGKTPEPLREDFSPFFMGMIQPDSTQLSEDPEIHLPGDTVFSNDTLFRLHYQSSRSSSWIPGGIATFSNGILNSVSDSSELKSLTLVAAFPEGEEYTPDPILSPALNSFDQVEGNALANNLPIGSQVNVNEGHFSISHTVPYYVSQGIARDLTFIFSSNSASNKKFLYASIPNSGNSKTVPTSYYVAGKINRPRDLAGQVIQDITFNGSFKNFSPGNKVLPIPMDLSNVKSGIYSAEISLISNFSARSSSLPKPANVPVMVNNNGDSRFGVGWSLVGYERLLFEDENDSIQIKRGNGSSYKFGVDRILSGSVRPNSRGDLGFITVDRDFYNPLEYFSFSEFLMNKKSPPVSVGKLLEDGDLSKEFDGLQFKNDTVSQELLVSLSPSPENHRKISFEMNHFVPFQLIGSDENQSDIFTVKFKDIELGTSTNLGGPASGLFRIDKQNFNHVQFRSGTISAVLLFKLGKTIVNQAVPNRFALANGEWIAQSYPKSQFSHWRDALNAFIQQFQELPIPFPATQLGSNPQLINSINGWSYFESDREYSFRYLHHQSSLPDDGTQDVYQFSPIGGHNTYFNQITLRIGIETIDAISTTTLRIGEIQLFKNRVDPIISNAANQFVVKSIPPAGLEGALYAKPRGAPDENEFFQLKYLNGTTQFFNKKGLPTKFIDRNKNQTLFVHQPDSDLLTQIVDPVGKTFSFSYSDGRISRVTDPAGRTTHFSMDNLNRVTQIQDPEGKSESFSYGPSSGEEFVLKSFKNKNGDQTNYSYDGYHRLTNISLPNGAQRTIQPGKMTGISNVGDPQPAIDAPNIGSNFETKISYGNQNVERYKHNSYGGLNQFTDGLGKSTEYAKDPRNHTTLIKDPNNVSMILERTGTGKILRGGFDKVSAISTFKYAGPFEQISEAWDPLSQRTSFSYDNTTGNLKTVVFSDGLTRHFDYDSRGLLTQVSGRTGRLVRYSHNSDGNVSTVSIGDKSSPSRFDYFSSGLIRTFTDPRGFVTRYEHDQMNRLVKITNPKGVVTRFSYDGEGNLLKTSYDVNGFNFSNESTYDKLNRLTQYKDEIGNLWKYEYDVEGYLIKVTNPKNVITTLLRDENNNVIKMVADSNGIKSTTLFVYFENQNLRHITDPNGNRTSYTYDQANRLIRTTFPDNNTKKYLYNQNHLLKQFTNQKGEGISYSYDRLNRLNGKFFNGNSYFFNFNKHTGLLDNARSNGNQYTFAYQPKTFELLTPIAI